MIVVTDESYVKYQNNLKQVESIHVVNNDVPMSVCDMILITYQQKNCYSSNRCVLLSTCLVVRSIDPALAQSMKAKFEWLTLFNKKGGKELHHYIIC